MGPDEIRLAFLTQSVEFAWEIDVAGTRNDAARAAAKCQDALALLERLEKNGSSAEALDGFRHTLAHHLNRNGRYDLALPCT